MFQRLDDASGVQSRVQKQTYENAQLCPATQTVKYSGEPRMIVKFDIDALILMGRRAEAIIVMECAVGDTLIEDTPILQVHGANAPISERELKQAIHLAIERTSEQDPKYPIRLLVDIAIKALSPAINDPTTAVQAIDQIEDLLRRLGRRQLDAGHSRDANGDLRLILPMPTWEDYLTLAFDEIRQYGAGSVQIMRRLRSALIGVAELMPVGERVAAVQRYQEHLDATIRRSGLDVDDQEKARLEDRQGLGMSRRTVERKTPAT